MKTIKVFGLPSHQTEDRTSGVDFVRIIQPITALNGYEKDGIHFETEMFDIKDKMDWLTVAKKFDVIFLNYIVDPWGYAAMGAMARAHNCKIVMDLDDALWYVRSDNPTAGAYKKNGENIRNLGCMLDDVDLVTCTNDYLRNVIIAQTNKKYERIKVIDNYIDIENTFTKKPSFKDTKEIRLSHHGSTTHFEDLQNEEFAKGVDRIMREYPNVTIEFIGAFIPKYRERWGMRYVDLYGARDIYEWSGKRFPELMKEVDIVITPLQDNIYTRCKSGIKYLENGAMGKPGVYQSMNQYHKYITHGENGYLANSADDWYLSIKDLIDNPVKRREMGENAYKTIQGETIQRHVGEYAEMFKELVAK